MLKVGINAAWCAGEKMRILTHVRIGGRQVLGVVVCGSGSRSLRIVNQRSLQLVGNEA